MVDTWLLASLLVTVFVASMLAVDLARRYTRPRGILVTVFAVVCLVLVVLRAQFPTLPKILVARLAGPGLVGRRKPRLIMT
jgi:hypothetical protein